MSTSPRKPQSRHSVPEDFSSLYLSLVYSLVLVFVWVYWVQFHYKQRMCSHDARLLWYRHTHTQAATRANHLPAAATSDTAFHFTPNVWGLPFTFSSEWTRSYCFIWVTFVPLITSQYTASSCTLNTPAVGAGPLPVPHPPLPNILINLTVNVALSLPHPCFFTANISLMFGNTFSPHYYTALITLLTASVV
jgi:hypothetical protein